MNVFATEYTREDGVTMHRQPGGRWVVRKIEGPSWFYDPSAGTWRISTAPDFNLDALSLPFEDARALLETVKR